MFKRAVAGIFLCGAMCGLAFGDAIAQVQATDARATAPVTSAVVSAFEVATVRPANVNDGRRWFGIKLAPSGRVTTSATPLTSLVRIAYIGLSAKSGSAEVSGGPKWAETDQWDIAAKVDDAVVAGWVNASDRDRMETIRPMLRSLLEERFALKLHTETKVVNAYALVQTKSGAKLKEASPPPANEDSAQAEARERGRLPDKPEPGSFQMGGSTWEGTAIPIEMLASEIQANAKLDAPLIDETGLNGYYSFTFTSSQDADAPPLLDQIEQQLGLKVIQKKESITTYVIDSAEKPTEN